MFNKLREFIWGQSKAERIQKAYLLPKRLVLVRRDCPYCKSFLRIVQEFNSNLLPEDRIHYIDITDAIDYKFHIPMLDCLDVPGVPYAIIDGIEINGMTSQQFAKILIHQLVKEDLLI